MKDPKGMTRRELVGVVRELINTSGQIAVRNLKEEWEIPDEMLEDLQFGNFVKDTSKIQHKSPNTKFIKFYQTEVKRLLDDKTLSHEDSGVLAHLAIYVEFEDNSLMLDKEYMTQKDMIKILGMGRSKLNNLLNKFKQENLIVEWKHPTDGRKRIYYLNPDVFFKGKNIKKHTKEYFNELKEENGKS